jgi:predicted SAM-dependent methyltransferase
MVEDAEYENNFFDYITFGAVLEHLYSPGGALEKAMKWLKPNGLVHLEVPSSRYLVAKIINFYYKLIGTSFVTNLSPMHNPYHLFEFDLKSFEEHAKKHNYEIAYRKYYVCSIPFFPGFLKPF